MRQIEVIQIRRLEFYLRCLCNITYRFKANSENIRILRIFRAQKRKVDCSILFCIYIDYLSIKEAAVFHRNKFKQIFIILNFDSTGSNLCRIKTVRKLKLHFLLRGDISCSVDIAAFFLLCRGNGIPKS